jgi:hypothetical protein
MSEFDFDAPEQKVSALRTILGSPAWRGYFEPLMMEARNRAIGLLVRPTEERRRSMSDDFLRARITILEELLTTAEAVIMEWDHTHEEGEAAVAYEQSVKERAELGRIGPLLNNWGRPPKE